MTHTSPATTGPWAQSCAEEEADLQALERALEMSPAQRQVALAVINSRRRTTTYRGEGSPAPLALPDGWGPPRWQQADAVTGGDNPTITSHLPQGSVLDCVAGGSVLSPLPKRDKKPISRCSRCGCWATPNNVILRNNVLWCRTCCGGTQSMSTDTSGASPPAP